MKLKLTLFLLYAFSMNYMQAQTSLLDNYQGRLYMTCNVWGFVKYHHSRVSICQLNWDSVLIATIPQIKAATDSTSFNKALLKMLNTAGPMAIATTPPPFIDPKLAINVDNKWMQNSYLSDSVQTILDTIRNNFRPHDICYVKDNDYTNPNNFSWLLFPGDSVTKVTSTYPAEPYRLFLIFKYWNIIHYFNPYNNIIDTPWDSTLYKNVLSVAQAKDKTEFYKAFIHMAAKLDDAHVDGLTWSASIVFPKGYNFPKLALKYADNKYVILKSQETGINKGDILLSIDGLTTQQWEDSLRPYVSAGNPSVFRREMCNLLLRGTYGSISSISYEDSLGGQL